MKLQVELKVDKGGVTGRYRWSYSYIQVELQVVLQVDTGGATGRYRWSYR